MLTLSDVRPEKETLNAFGSTSVICLVPNKERSTIGQKVRCNHEKHIEFVCLMSSFAFDSGEVIRCRPLHNPKKEGLRDDDRVGHKLGDFL
jgi:hypothetical protein